MLRNIFLIAFFASYYSFGYVDFRSDATIELEDSLFVLNNQENYKASYQLIQSFRKEETITADDQYFSLLYLSFLHKRLFDYNKVQVYLDSASVYVPKTSNPKQFEINQKCQKSFAYFDVQEYDLALAIMLEIESDVALNLSNEDLSIYYMQQGYIHFLNGDFPWAEEKLSLSEKIMSKHAESHLPIVYTKKMELYAAMGLDSLVELNLEKSLLSAKKHGIKKYEILTYLVRKNIAEKEKKFDTYLAYDLLFDQSENEYNSNKHLLEIAETEKQYQLKFKAIELEQTNLINRRLVYFSILICFILFVVIFFWRRVIFLGKQLKNKHDELTVLDKLNKEIFSVISHDLKEPLVAINFFLDEIKKNGITKSSNIIPDLENQIQSTSIILQDLLTWSAVELRIDKNMNESADIEKIISTTKQYFKQTIDQKNISIELIKDKNNNLEIDPWVCSIVIRNLLSNAIKFSHKNGEIKIVVKTGSISVIDEGMGLSKLILESKFDARQRPDYGTLGESGFGIGLYLSQVLLSRNGFDLKAVQNEPKGAIFQIIKN